MGDQERVIERVAEGQRSEDDVFIGRIAWGSKEGFS